MLGGGYLMSVRRLVQSFFEDDGRGSGFDWLVRAIVLVIGGAMLLAWANSCAKDYESCEGRGGKPVYTYGRYLCLDPSVLR